jgi:uncharacterized membrane-anchored protein YhcB (DUF1043 family)
MFGPKRYPKYILIFGFWTLIALLIGIQSYIGDVQRGYTCGFVKTLLTVFPNYFVWGFYTLIILWLTKRYPITSDTLWRSIFAIHLPTSVAISLIHVVALSLYYWQINVSDPMPFTNYLEKFLFYKFLYQVGMYAGVLIGCLSFTMYDRYNQERAQVNQLEKLLAESRLDALKMQLQPHFLFNTLNTISMLVRKKDEQMATKVLATLADLLRYVLENRQVRWVQLRKEVEFIEKYLSIERVRFNERLTYAINIDPNAGDLLIPDLLLQPIIENSVKHGISAKAEGGEIRIQARCLNEHLEISITDNGVGFDEKGQRLLSKGIGLRNIEERIANIYGGDGHFQIVSAPNAGTRVEFRLPIQKEVIYEPE